MPNKLKKNLSDSVMPMLIVSVVLLIPELLGWKDGHLEAHGAQKELLNSQLANYQVSISSLLNEMAELKKLVKGK